jgi:thiamine pyrophosphate-dependent acetolactate synthase large subunit-like protein
MTQNGGQIIGQVLKKFHVPFLFTLCGGHISPILVAAKQLGIRIVDVRDEATAVFAADAAARLTGTPGVAAVTAGPGVTNTLTAVKNAQMAQSPLVLLGGAAPTVLKHRGALQDIDQIAAVLTMVKTAMVIEQNCDIVPVLEKAFETAVAGVPGPVFVECPIDVLYDEALVRKWYGATDPGPGKKDLRTRVTDLYLKRHVDRIFACDPAGDDAEAAEPTFRRPAPRDLERIGKKLATAGKPVLIVGSQAMLAPQRTGELAAAVTRLGLPVYLTGMARGLLGKDHPLQLRHNRRAALKAADTVLLAGMPCDFRLNYGRAIPRRTALIAVNRSRTDLNLNRKPDMGVLGDPADLLCALAREGGHTPPAEWLGHLRSEESSREQAIDGQAAATTDFVNPLAFFRTLDRFIDERSVIIGDGGDFVASAAYVLRPRKPLSWLDPGVFGTLGVGAGFSLGAALCRPDSEIWLIYGDGAAGYSLQEFDTMVRHGIAVIAVVGNDGSWAQIARDQKEIFGDDVATALRRTDYHKVAQGYGGEGLVIETPDQVRPALEQARALARAGRPVLINLLIGSTDFRKGSISM